MSVGRSGWSLQVSEGRAEYTLLPSTVIKIYTYQTGQCFYSRQAGHSDFEGEGTGYATPKTTECPLPIVLPAHRISSV